MSTYPTILRRSLVVVHLLWAFVTAAAQPAQPDPATRPSADTANPFVAALHVRVRSYGDSVVLRWAPSRPGAWLAYSGIGYVVERKSTNAPATSTPFERLTPAPLRAWNLDEWKTRSRRANTYAGIAAQCLYGSMAVPNPATMDAMTMAATDLRNRHAFALLAADLDIVAADGLGLRFVDRSVVAGERYVYRIVTAARDTMYTLDTAVAAVAVDERTSALPPLQLRASATNGTVHLVWDALPLEGASAYLVERIGSDGTVTNLTPMPYVPMATTATAMVATPVFDDTTAGIGVPWRYRVTAIDAFGDRSTPAEIAAAGRDAVPPPVPNVEIPAVFGSSLVRLGWTPMTDVGDLAGYLVERGPSADGPFLVLTPDLIDRRSEGYLDTAGTPDEPFYIVTAVDTAGNRTSTHAMYAELVDTLPPSVPTGLVGLIDSTGLVFLTWNRGPERDLDGYRVLWANDSTHVFTAVSSRIHHDTVFIDSVSLETSTADVYYRLVAVDSRQYHSSPGPILRLRRPDMVPPEAPLLSDVIVTDSAVTLVVVPSTSGDVHHHLIERTTRTPGGGLVDVWSRRDSLPGRPERWTDTAVVPGVTYDYRAIAVDSNGLRSEPSQPMHGRPYGASRLQPVRRIDVSYDSTAGITTVVWECDAVPSEAWFVIYRGFEDYDLHQYRAVKAADRRFVDTDLVGNGRYRYAIRLLSATAESPMSEERALTVGR